MVRIMKKIGVHESTGYEFTNLGDKERRNVFLYLVMFQKIVLSLHRNILLQYYNNSESK